MNEYAIGILEEKKERLIKKGRDVLGNTINKLQQAIDILSTGGKDIYCDDDNCIWNKGSSCDVRSLDIRNGRCDLSTEGKVIAEGIYKGVVLGSNGVMVLLDNKSWQPANEPNYEKRVQIILNQIDK